MKGSIDMARDKLNTEAYDLSLFEPQKKVNKKENRKEKTNLIKINASQSLRNIRKKINVALTVRIAVCTAFATAVAAWMVCNYVSINELTQEINDAQSSLVHQSNLEAEYQLRIDSKLTQSEIQKYAEQNLGMSQVKNVQKRFISLSDGDIGEVIRDDGKNTVLESLKGIFKRS